MKTTKKQENIGMANELISAIERQKNLEKHIEQLKSALKAELGDESAMQVGDDILILLADAVRSSIDSERLAADIGAVEVEKYLKVTNYKKFSIKRI